VYAQRHLVAPLRDEKGVAAVVVDMSLGEMDAPSAFESRQTGHMMNLLTAANADIVADSLDGQAVRCIGKSSQLLVCSGVAILRVDQVQQEGQGPQYAINTFQRHGFIGLR